MCPRICGHLLIDRCPPIVGHHRSRLMQLRTGSGAAAPTRSFAQGRGRLRALPLEQYLVGMTSVRALTGEVARADPSRLHETLQRTLDRRTAAADRLGD